MNNMAQFQETVTEYVIDTFGAKYMENQKERAMRFIEEAVELSQAIGLSKDQCQQVVEYVFNRPVGNVAQEVGGTMVTLATLCSSAGIHMGTEAWKEFNRINTPEMQEKLRQKQLFKKNHGLTIE